RLDLAPGEIALIPRGMTFRIDCLQGPARGFVCENYGAPFRLPELGPLGANGLANPRDFLVPAAAFEDSEESVEWVVKSGGLWSVMLGRSPFDVVAWHGNYVPCKYDLARFNAMNSVTFDHPDPSIFTVLTAPSGLPGVANVDFVVFPPRWNVAEATFRPPWFHRNVMSEFVASISGVPEARAAAGYGAGTCHLHNGFAAHGPDVEVVERASTAELVPAREESLAIMFETRLPLRVTRAALRSPNLQADYDRNWDRLRRRFPAGGVAQG
ncbi:MAG: homogentisate 1,2-dioxygenase domain-containing protein, partial [Stellaceae bacterium]